MGHASNDWTKETAVAVAAETRFDASAGAGRDASFTFICLLGDLEIRCLRGDPHHRSGDCPISV